MERTMRKFIIRCGVFALPLAAYVVVVNAYNQSIQGSPIETESNLVQIGEDQVFDWVMLGTSQSRTFSRAGVAEVADAAIQREWLNLSQGSGGGGLPALYSLKYFYQRGNRADTVLYFVSPWVFFTEESNTTHPMTRREPFRADFLWTLLNDTTCTAVERKNYLYRLFAFDWESACTWEKQGEPLHSQQLSSIDPVAQGEARDFMQQAVDEGAFERFKHVIQELQDVCSAQGSTLIFVDAPILMDDLPGQAMVDRAIRETGCTHLDVPQSVLQPAYFYDHMHMNSVGVQHYFEQFLNPALH